MKKIYIVTINRDNQIETVVVVTPNKTTAHLRLLAQVKSFNPAMARGLLREFSDGTINDEVAFYIGNGMHVQLTNYTNA